MPWIKTVMHLPVRPRRAHLQGFGLIAALTAGAGIGLLAEEIQAGWLWPVLAAGVLLAGAVYRRPTVMRGPYEIWCRLTDWYMRIARWMIKAICFFVLFVVVGRGGSALPVRPHANSSKWGERKSLRPEEFMHEYQEASERPPTGQWISTYMRWARDSGNGWVILLLPFLILLAFFDEQEESEFPQNIYTLF